MTEEVVVSLPHLAAEPKPTITLHFCARCKQLLWPRMSRRRHNVNICPRCSTSVMHRWERLEGTFSDEDAALMLRQPL
jgi:DNA-directed RNA polymerase subunit RPC12/RpoP